MNISNTISYGPIDSKREVSDLAIKEKPLEVKNNINFNDKLNKLDKSDQVNRVDKEEKLENIEALIESSNRTLAGFDRKLDISIHENTRQVMVKVIDTSTDEIIREVPAEKMLDNLATRKELIGVLVDKEI